MRLMRAQGRLKRTSPVRVSNCCNSSRPCGRLSPRNTAAARSSGSGDSNKIDSTPATRAPSAATNSICCGKSSRRFKSSGVVR